MSERTHGFSFVSGVVLLALVAHPTTALAFGNYYSYAGAVQSTEKLAKVRGEYYDATVSGMVELCDAHADLCAHPNLQARLSQLQNHRIAAYSLYGAAGASYVGGMIYGLAGDDTAYAIYAGMGLGAVLWLAGLIVMPRESAVQRFVNAANTTNVETSIDWHLGTARTAFGESVALNFSF